MLTDGKWVADLHPVQARDEEGGLGLESSATLPA